MIASLPMYDRAETAGALDRLWAHVREAYPGATPDHLTRGSDPWSHWRDPGLVLSQACGMPYRTGLHAHVDLVGTPVHAEIGGPPGSYHSVIVVRSDDDRDFGAFAGATLAYNDPLSQSGWAAPWSAAREAGFSFTRAVRTGSHLDAALAVATDRADIAAIDAVSWDMMLEWEPFAAILRELLRTPPTPALPFVTAKGGDADGLFRALDTAIGGLSEADRKTLRLGGLTRVSHEAYLGIETPPPPPQ